MTEQWMPGNKKELMSVIEHEWKLLLNLAESLTDEQMTKPDSGGWSPKDNLAHLAEWMNLLEGYHMDKRPYFEVIGVTQEEVPEWSVEAVNPFLFKRNQNRSRTEVMEMLKRTYNQLIAKLENTPFDDLFKPRHADAPEKGPLMLWVLGDTSEHFQEHRETIEKGIKTSS